MLDIEDVSLEVVEKAARDVMASYPQPPRDESEEEHLRELKGLLLEFEDWKLCDIRDRQHMLISRFRNLLFNLGCNDKTCKEVSLPYLQNELGNLESRGHSLRFVSNLKCILRKKAPAQALILRASVTLVFGSQEDPNVISTIPRCHDTCRLWRLQRCLRFGQPSPGGEDDVEASQ